MMIPWHKYDVFVIARVVENSLGYALRILGQHVDVAALMAEVDGAPAPDRLRGGGPRCPLKATSISAIVTVSAGH